MKSIALPLPLHWLLIGLTMLASMVLVAGCGDDDDGNVPTATATLANVTAAARTPTATAAPEIATTVPLAGSISVFAAVSLTDAFSAVGNAFKALHSGVDVQFNFASSSALATQINEGAPADVFASADTAQMKVVTDAGNAADPVLFARNVLVVVVPATSNLMSFADLANPGLRIVLAGPDVPVGRYSRQILDKASAPGGIAPNFGERVLANLRSDEANVRAVLSKVQLGEADAGIVYQTDAAIAGDDVKVIAIPEAFNVIAEYPIAVVTESGEAEIATEFIAFLLSDAGQSILRDFGFAAP